MRIATKTLIVVLVCLIGAGLSATVVFVDYRELEDSRYQREVSLLALRDADNFRTITSQWFVTIDLFFFEKQGYLASGIKKQATQMQEIIDIIQSYNNADDSENLNLVKEAINITVDSVGKASILEDQDGKEWNNYIDLMDEQAGVIIDEIEILYENYQTLASERQVSYDNRAEKFKQTIFLSIGIYLIFVFASWLWASRTIAKPVELLTSVARHADIDESGLSFTPDKGPKEIKQLGASLQHFYENLFQARQKSEKRKQELQQSLDELAETRLQLVQSEKLASVGQLASGVAHEINNPIGFISGNFSTLKSYTDDLKEVIEKHIDYIESSNKEDIDQDSLLEEVKKFQEQKDIEFIIEDLSSLLEDSHTGLERVKKIVSDLLEFSHVNAPNLTEVDINELFNKTINLMDQTQKENIEFRTVFGEIPPVICHGGKIGQAMMNILVNSSEAIARKTDDGTPTSGIVQVTTQAKNNKVYIDIQDNGCGIEEANISRIFDPFYTTKAIGEGTGLGLHITQSILDNHDGHLYAISELHKGTKIRIELPIKQ